MCKNTAQQCKCPSQKSSTTFYLEADCMMTKLLRLLQIEDCESDAALIVRLLKKAEYVVQGERLKPPLKCGRLWKGRGGTW